MNEFERLLTRDHLAARLGLRTSEMTWWIWALRESRRYREFDIKRRNGGPPRRIQTPIKPIRDMQTRLLPMLASDYEPWPHVHGFVVGRSAVSNAQVHRGQRWILRIDLKDFFSDDQLRSGTRHVHGPPVRSSRRCCNGDRSDLLLSIQGCATTRCSNLARDLEPDLPRARRTPREVCQRGALQLLAIRR